jgi:hypothetical protein
MKALFAAIIVIGTLTGYAQTKPTVPAQTPPQKVDPAKPAEVHVDQVTATMKPEDIKALKDALSMLQLDQLAVQTAQNTFSQTDPVAKKAIAIFNEAVAASPDVQKATTQMNTDRTALLAKIDKLRTDQKLDKSWDWDFNQGKFVKTNQPAPPAK